MITGSCLRSHLASPAAMPIRLLKASPASSGWGQGRHPVAPGWRPAIVYGGLSTFTIRRVAVRCIAVHRKGHHGTAGGSGLVLLMAEIGYVWQAVAARIEQ